MSKAEDYLLARLCRDAQPEHNPDAADRRRKADLLASVQAGAISPHAAAVEAGYRKDSIILTMNPQEAARRILERFQGGTLRELIRLLREGLDRS